MINNKTKDDFVREVLSDINLDSIVEWIRNSLSPDDVFDGNDLKEWALTSGLEPEELCGVLDLERWAETNDFIRVGDLKEWALTSGLEPEELCGVLDLERWAETNDFIRFY